MPIYAYKCSSCGHAADVMQKFSDAPLTQCPACGAETYSKQITAPNFALKGSGWYVTDFRNNGAADKSSKPAADASASKPADSAPSAAPPATSAAPTSAAPAAAPTTSTPAASSPAAAS
ncbi:MAG: FmdB family zinc ribbon protein [Burkholderiales bacterium]|jgi:putative FmdB family regulatory protein|nr:zinc ribbon domain-containing protein [Nitrosomonadaceae bacterium]